MGVLRSILHIATLGIVDSNEEVARKNTPFVFPYNISESEITGCDMLKTLIRKSLTIMQSSLVRPLLIICTAISE